MKYILAIIALFSGAILPAQVIDLDGATTRAVVIGISDYQDEKIPDLRFADRDAEAFANFLRSPAGGSLDGDHLKLLTNQNATAGRIAEALDALIEQAKEGDQVIIYFSGHGDVEGKKLSQPGFLLCWDSPSRVYMGGGTYSLAYLQEIVSTLSVQNKAKVVVITDACHAGKLSGSQIGGAQLTAANLAKQFANEVKILSCQPNEYSLEGEQWGGGRGCFSYHLVEGLFGLADRNGDQTVTVGEIDRYLEDHVTAEAAPQSQVPMLLGNKTERLATVDAAVLAELQKNKSGQMPVFAATEGRGFEDEVLAKVDTSIREMYRAFKRAVEEKRFLEPAGNCAEDYYAQLTQVEALAPLRGMMKRNYAAALIDEGQQIINRYLKGDRKAEGILYYSEKGVIHRQWANQFYRAAELLGENHYFYPKLMAKALYFESFAVHDLPISSDSATTLDIKLMRKALAFDSISPYIWRDLAMLSPLDSTDFYVLKLNELAPNWIIWYSDFGNYYGSRNPEKAIQFHQKAIELDSTCVASLNGIALPLQMLGRHEEATRYRETAVRIGLGELEKNETSLSYNELMNLAASLKVLQRYEEAEEIGKKVIAMDSTKFSGWVNLSWTYHAQQRYEEAEVVNKKYIELYPAKADGWIELGITYRLHQRFEEAEIVFKKAIELDSTGVYSRRQLGRLYNDMKRFDDAIMVFEKAISLDSLNSYIWGQLGWTYFLAQRYPEAERILKKVISMDSTNVAGFNDLAMVHFKTNRLEEARQGFHKAIVLGPIFKKALLGIAYTYASEGKMEEALAYVEQAIQKKATYEELQKDEDLASLRATPEWKGLMKKYFPDQAKD